MRGLTRVFRPGWRYSQAFLLVLFLLAVAATYYFWRLGSLTAGLGPAEYLSRQNSIDLTLILKSGINAPYFLLQHTFSAISPSSFALLRLSSVVLALFIFGCLFGLLRTWFGKLSALLGGLIFISTGWLIVIARNAGPIIMWLWPVVLVALFVWTVRAKRRLWPMWIALCAAVAIGLYTPGLVWLVLAAGLFGQQAIGEIIKRLSRRQLAVGSGVAVLLLAPLIQALILQPSQIRVLFLIPQHLPSALTALKSIGWSAVSLFWQTPFHIDTIVGRLPILNILQLSLCVFGIYALVARAARMTYFLLALLAFAVIASGLNANIELLGMGLVSVAVFLAGGMRYLYIEWRRVFPLNPISRALALALIALVVMAQMFYGIRYGLVAWPNTEATKSTYVLK